MVPFTLTRATTPAEAIAALGGDPQARFIAGGTNLVDLLKEGVETPARLIDITRVEALDHLADMPEGGVRIGALVKNSDLADYPDFRRRYPLVAQALLGGASPQLRNAASVGGNLLQRTRCYYFTDVNMACNKRAPGQGCAAREGFHHIHAVLGWSDACIATHPSDMAVAMVAQDAVVHVEGSAGPRAIPLVDFHRLPGDDPARDTVLEHGELITAVELPPSPWGNNVHYLKVRERSSYAFAAVSVAAALRLEEGRVADARLVLGGVAHKPWRSAEAEAALTGQPAGPDAFARAGEAAIADARPLRDNAYKVPLAKHAVARALEFALAGEPRFVVSN